MDNDKKDIGMEEYLHNLGILTDNYLNNLRLRLILETRTRFFLIRIRPLHNVELSYDKYNRKIFFLLHLNKSIFFAKKKKFFKKIQSIISESLPTIIDDLGKNTGFSVEISYVKKEKN